MNGRCITWPVQYDHMGSTSDLLGGICLLEYQYRGADLYVFVAMCSDMIVTSYGYALSENGLFIHWPASTGALIISEQILILRTYQCRS